MADSKELSSQELSSVFLPEEVIFQILCRLPVKAIIRFKSVCKLWLSVIRNPNFVRAHLHFSSSKRYLIATYPCKEGAWRLLIDRDVVETASASSASSSRRKGSCVDEIPLVSDADDVVQKMEQSSVRFFNSCDGLVCFSESAGTLRVLNPVTRESLDLFPPRPRTLFWTYSFSLIVSDPSSFSYKVLYVVYRDGPFVFTLGKDVSWRRLDCTGLGDAKEEAQLWMGHTPCVFSLPLHGVPYGKWYAPFYANALRQVLVFDPQSEDLQRISLPHEVANAIGKYPYAFRGSLYMICQSRESESESQHLIEVWMMTDMESTERWTMIGNHNLRSIDERILKFSLCWIEVLGVVGEGIVLKIVDGHELYRKKGIGCAEFFGFYDPIRDELTSYCNKFKEDPIDAELIGTIGESLLSPN